MKLKQSQLPSGVTGFFNDQNEWVATGSQMGRRDVIPDDRRQPAKLSMIRLDFVGGDYDKGGAYWGSGLPIYWAQGDCGEIVAQVFVRASNRTEAKSKVRETLPNAKFFN